MILIAPSWVLADHTQMAESVAALEAAGADRLHVDFMDGKFVANFGCGVHEVEALRACTKLPLDFHLMLDDPMPHLDMLVGLGADIITVHPETCCDVLGVIAKIQSLGAGAALALSPEIPAEVLEPVLQQLQCVLVFLIRPGFTGQTMKPELLEKVRRVRSMIDVGGGAQELVIDGGVRLHTIEEIARTGGNSYIVGSVIFNHTGGLAAGIREVRTLAQRGYEEGRSQRKKEAQG